MKSLGNLAWTPQNFSQVLGPLVRALNERIMLVHAAYQLFSDIILDDVQKLQKAYVDLEIAKTISLAAKTNMKRRTIMLRRARRRDNLEEIDVVWQFFLYFDWAKMKEEMKDRTNTLPLLAVRN